MKLKRTLLGALLLALGCCGLSAAPLLTEGFETYARGALDAEIPGGPNNNTNNGWAGPFPEPENCVVVGAETSPNGISVTPHGGTNMVRGSLRAGDFDEDLYNLSYWLNKTNGYSAFFGNFTLDWYFFDPIGQGTNGAVPSQYCDALSLAFFGSEPSNAPYDPNIASDGIGDPTPSISIGGASDTSPVMTGSNELSGYDATKYQANDSAENGYDGFGWFNIPTAVRSVGWHHARLDVFPVNPADGSVGIVVYVDNMSVPGLRLNSSALDGFNAIELNANFCTSTNISAYYDDISFTLLPPQTFTATMSGTNAIISWSNSWILQSSPSLASGVWTDVVDSNTNFVTSPYTNKLSASPQLFFRLRN